MLHACVERFDVWVEEKIFWVGRGKWTRPKSYRQRFLVLAALAPAVRTSVHVRRARSTTAPRSSWAMCCRCHVSGDPSPRDLKRAVCQFVRPLAFSVGPNGCTAYCKSVLRQNERNGGLLYSCPVLWALSASNPCSCCYIYKKNMQLQTENIFAALWSQVTAYTLRNHLSEFGSAVALNWYPPLVFHLVAKRVKWVSFMSLISYVRTYYHRHFGCMGNLEAWDWVRVWWSRTLCSNAPTNSDWWRYLCRGSRPSSIVAMVASVGCLNWCEVVQAVKQSVRECYPTQVLIR
jgi:hypothetical protein